MRNANAIASLAMGAEGDPSALAPTRKITLRKAHVAVHSSHNKRMGATEAISNGFVWSKHEANSPSLRDQAQREQSAVPPQHVRCRPTGRAGKQGASPNCTQEKMHSNYNQELGVIIHVVGCLQRVDTYTHTHTLETPCRSCGRFWILLVSKLIQGQRPWPQWEMP